MKNELAYKKITLGIICIAVVSLLALLLYFATSMPANALNLIMSISAGIIFIHCTKFASEMYAIIKDDEELE